MHPRTATESTGRALPAMIITLAILGSGLANVSVAHAQGAGGHRELRDAAPADAYMYLYSAQEGRSQVVCDYVDEVMQAVADAHFDQLVLEVLSTALPPEELQMARGVHAEVSRMLRGLPWDALGESEFLMARGFAMNQAHSFQDSIMLGLKLPEGRSAEMHQSMRDLVAGVLQMIGSDKVSLQATVGRGSETRIHSTITEFPDVASLVASGKPVVYTVVVRPDAYSIRDATEHQHDGAEQHHAVVMQQTGLKFAFVGDSMLLGLSPDVNDSYLDRALGYLTGEPSEGLTSSARFQNALSSVNSGGYELFYMDFPNMFEPMFDFASVMIDSEASAQEALFIKAIMQEVDDLLSPLGSVVTMTHAQDETHIVADGVFQYLDVPATAKNPFFLMAQNKFRGDPEMLSAVPADATSFHAYTGLDIGPLHDWMLERVERYVPESKRVLAAYEAGQGALGIDVRDDLLMLVGSGVTSATFPARRPTAVHAEDTVVVARPSNPAGAKALNKRLMRILRAGGMFQEELNGMIQQLEQQVPMLVMVGLKLEMAEAPEAFPGMVRVTLTAFGQHNLYFGMVGDQWMASSSPEALHYVLETMSGEHPDIRSSASFAQLANLPEDGPLWSVRLADYSNVGRDLQQAVAAMQGFAPMMLMGISQGNQDAPEAKAMAKALEVLPRLAKIFSHIDFLGRTVSWTQVSDDGMQERFHTVLEYKDPAERARTR